MSTVMLIIQIIKIVGPQIKELLPILKELIASLRDANSGSPRLGSSEPNENETDLINHCVSSGCDESEAVELINLLK